MEHKKKEKSNQLDVLQKICGKIKSQRKNTKGVPVASLWEGLCIRNGASWLEREGREGETNQQPPSLELVFV